VCGQITSKNRLFFFKRGRSPKIIRSFSFYFFYKAYHAKHWGVLHHKYCKEEAFVVTQFFIHLFDKIFGKSFSKNNEKQRKSKKIYFKYICIVFSIFSIVSKEFNFSKVFWTRSTFHTLFLKSLIFLIELILIMLFSKNKKKYKKLKFYKKTKLSNKF